MKKYSSSRGSSALSYFFAFVALIVLALSGLFIANLYLNKPTQLGSQASTNGVIPSETQRESVPAGAIPLNNGVGITNNAAMNGGNFQVEAFCSRKNLGNVSQNSTDWFCGSYTLQVKDYDEICRMTYNNAGAFVVRTGTSSTKAYNWRCHAFSGVNTTSATGVACGEPCGAQSNGVVLPFNCANGGVCGNVANGGTSGNRCLPVGVAGYSTKGGNCANDPNPGVFCINKSDGTRVSDEAGIRTACAAATNTTTTTTTTTAQGVSDLNKNGKADPDDYRLFIEDYRLQLSKQ